MTTVRIPPVLRAETDGHRDVAIAGETVREVLDGLVAQFPDLDGRLLADGQPRPFVNLFLDGTDVRTLDGLDTAVGPESMLLLLPAMAGGARANAATSKSIALPPLPTREQEGDAA